ncbi:MAG: polyprenol phosphomannose-dependent alpha 1,6 mannosyltransferase MptB [Acidimicrobiia bacterium]|nr:polyprenol phosphomannose-dependent alpha 1,6 mannosyltransferase MptB [Acidimicrobiia bacterium]
MRGERGTDENRIGSSLPFIAALGFSASALVVAGGTLAGASGPGGTGRMWSVPAVPVTPSASLLPALVTYFGGLILLVRAWLLLRRYHLRFGLPVATVALFVVVWAVPMLVGPPLGSRDVYAYAAQGRMAEQGLDVYEEGPAELGEGDPVLVPVDPVYWESPSLYGPVFVSMSRTVAGLTGDHVVAAVFAFRLMAVLGLLVTALAVLDLSRGLNRDPVDALILAIANPLVLFHLVSGAHNEAIMLAFLVSGVAVARRRGAWVHLGIVLCTLAAAIKIPALLAVPFLGWHWALDADRWSRRVARVTLAVIEATVVMAVAGRVTGWGWEWLSALANSRPVNAYLSITRLFGGGVSLLTGIEPDLVLAAARLLGLAFAAAVTGVLLLRRHQSWPTALAWSLLLWAILHPTTQPWYLTWGIIILAATSAGDRNRGFVALCAAAVFAVLPIGPELGWALLDDSSVGRILVGAAVLLVLTFSPGSDVTPRYRSDLDRDLVTIIVPTRHERLNIVPFVYEMCLAVNEDESLRSRGVEILYVDDSDDATPAVIERAASDLREGAFSKALANGRSPVQVSLLHRHREQRWGGLSGAVVDGFAHAAGRIVVVMDGDLQHPASDVSRLVAQVSGGAHLAVASRRIPGGTDGEGLTRTRWLLSQGGAHLARLLFPRRVGRVADPLSGFFAVDLSRINLDVLHPDGFKILTELLATHPDARVVEVPFRFAGRVQGMSKASATEGTRFFGHLFDLRIRTTRWWGGASISQRVDDRAGRAIASS